MSGHLVLIASYPKSGNTWTRLVFEHLLRGEGAPVSINDIGIGFYGWERRRYFDSLAPVAAADLLPDEIENLLPDLYARLALEADGPVFIKVHDMARLTPGGRWLFPVEHVRAVIYLVRHPFDVAASYAHHRAITVAEAVADLCDEGHVIAPVAAGAPLPVFEKPGSWQTHLDSWTQGSPYPVTVARYEDLILKPQAEFARLAAAAGLQVSAREIAAAVEGADFQRLKAEEERAGFRERPGTSPAFFNAGRPGTGAEALGHQLSEQLAMQLADGMARFSYLAGVGSSCSRADR